MGSQIQEHRFSSSTPSRNEKKTNNKGKKKKEIIDGENVENVGIDNASILNDPNEKPVIPPDVPEGKTEMKKGGKKKGKKKKQKPLESVGIGDVIHEEEEEEEEEIERDKKGKEKGSKEDATKKTTKTRKIKKADIFAVVQMGGHQYKITKGDLIIINKIEADINTQIRINKVLLVGGKTFTAIGRPLVSGATVLATVEEHAKTKKIIVFKMKRRKTHKRWRGSRHPFTVLRIDDISYTPAPVADPYNPPHPESRFEYLGKVSEPIDENEKGILVATE